MNPITTNHKVPGIIQLEFKNQVSSDRLNHTLEEVIASRKSQEISRILLKYSNTSDNLPVAEVFRFGVEIARWSTQLIVALVDRPEISTQLTFLETVARNRGAHVKLFQSAQEAESWLGSQYVA